MNLKTWLAMAGLGLSIVAPGADGNTSRRTPPPDSARC